MRLVQPLSMLSTLSTIATLVLASCASTMEAAPSSNAGQSTAAEVTTEHSPAAVTGTLVAHFDTALGQLPEGLVLNGDTAFVGFAPTSQVARVELSTGVAEPYGELPLPIANKGFMTGLAQSPSGEIYAGLASFVPEVQAGIYRIPKAGGAATLFAKDEALPFPNALAFDANGELWVTDSATGSVFRIDAEGQAARWATGSALSGDKDACGGAGPGFAIGANGLVIEPDAVYVVNMDQATLVQIPRDSRGEAGTPNVLAGPDCDNLGGADGLARAAEGGFVVAVNRQNKLVRVNSDGTLETLLSGPPLDFPATLAYRGTTLYATNFALRNASAGKPAAPGLVKIL